MKVKPSDRICGYSFLPDSDDEEFEKDIENKKLQTDNHPKNLTQKSPKSKDNSEEDKSKDNSEEDKSEDKSKNKSDLQNIESDTESESSDEESIFEIKTEDGWIKPMVGNTPVSFKMSSTNFPPSIPTFIQVYKPPSGSKTGNLRLCLMEVIVCLAAV